jgi:hypothetical protein
MSYPDMYKYGLSNDQLNVINPDELFEIVKKHISEKGYAIQVKKCKSNIDADSAKIYYYITGQKDYNKIGDITYNSILTISKDIDSLIGKASLKVQSKENSEVLKVQSAKSDTVAQPNNNLFLIGGLALALGAFALINKKG